MSSSPITVERIERAIDTVADMMVKHGLPLRPTIDFLEAERDKLLRQTTDMDYAKQIVARKRRNKGSNIDNQQVA